jgi:quercetin dioxygenase-like cupin family protein
MPFIDTKSLAVWERLPGWRGRFYRSESMTFAYWEFDAGASVHEHQHPNEEVWNVIGGEIEVTIDGETQRAGPGAVAIVPFNSRHAVQALTDGRALVVDHPVRSDAPIR